MHAEFHSDLNRRSHHSRPAAHVVGFAAILLLCLAPAACSRSGPRERGGGTPGATAGQQHAGKDANASQGSGGKTQSDLSEPASSVNGKPSTASDNGSPSAVAGRSIAEPGAPEGTLQRKKPAPPRP